MYRVVQCMVIKVEASCVLPAVPHEAPSCRLRQITVQSYTQHTSQPYPLVHLMPHNTPHASPTNKGLRAVFIYFFVLR